jgi:alkylation response protein AidB-like acyl-CoA dehydrogenase
MDFSLDPPHREFVSELDRRFQAGIARRAAAADRDGAMPPENWADIVDSGYLRVFHSKAIGGLGVDGVTQAMVMESLARACSGTYWSATMSTLLCGKLISTYGNPSVHGHLIDAILRGDQLGCFAVVERAAGSDPATYQTLVRKSGNEYVIEGEKARITNAPNADIAVVLARLEEARRGDGPGWCYAFVNLRQEGVRRYKLPNMGLRAMPWGGLIFEDARINKDDVVPVALAEFPDGMAWGWLFISISSIAIAESALAASLEHASQQTSFGRPLAHMQGIQARLAEMRAEVDAARLTAWRASWHRGEGRSARQLIGMLKPYATEMAVRVTQQAVHIHGSWGLTRDYLIERLCRDAPMNVIGGFAASRLREVVAEGMGIGQAQYAPFDWLAPTGLVTDPGGTATTSLAQLGA